MDYKNIAVESNHNLRKALKSEIWRERLLKVIKEKKASIQKLSDEANWMTSVLDREKASKPPKWAFIKRVDTKRVSLLKEFIFKDDSLWVPDSGMQHGILFKLEHWQMSPDGNYPMYGKPDIANIFVSFNGTYPPLDRGYEIAKEKGWIYYKEAGIYKHFLTDKGIKLPRVKAMIAWLDQLQKWKEEGAQLRR